MSQNFINKSIGIMFISFGVINLIAIIIMCWIPAVQLFITSNYLDGLSHLVVGLMGVLMTSFCCIVGISQFLGDKRNA